MSLKEFIDNYFWNDSNLLGVYGLMFLSSLLIMAVAIYFHELGHWIYFKLKLKKTIKIRFEWNSIYNFKWKAGEQKDYDGITDAQYVKMLFFGIVIGLLPILFMGYVWLGYLLLIIPYLAGSMGDIKEIIKTEQIVEEIIKEEEKKI